MQGLYVRMWWELLTLKFHKESFVLGQKTIPGDDNSDESESENDSSSHWQITKNTYVTKKCFWFMNQNYWN